MTKGYDYLTATRRCAARLRELGMTDWSEKLIDALDSAGTGGELVMGVRSHLQQLERSGKVVPEDLKRFIADIIREIDATGW